MTKEELAELLHGREYGSEIERHEVKLARENGLVVVFGYSDDVTEFRGAIDDELGSGLHEFTKAGVFKHEDDEEVLEKYGNPVAFNKIKSVWNPKDSKGAIFASWAYETEIPHVTFDIVDEGVMYCRGIVFSINDLK
jgi:hypothetical protein